MGHAAILLPGAVMPATPAYAGLIAELDVGIDARAKDLEVYAGKVPPPDYSLRHEVEGVERFADAAGFKTFHLVGYSGGGASALMYAAVHPGRLGSLVLMEPAWAGNEGLVPEEQAMRVAFRRLADRPADDFMAGFIKLQLDKGVAPPPPAEGPPPPWMAKRPAGVKAFLAAFESDRLDLDRLRGFAGPVCFILGGRSSYDYYGRMAERLGRVFKDYTIETFPERHHFDPPHRIEPKRVAGILRRVWTRADSVGRQGGMGF